MNYTEIETKVKDLMDNYSKETFVYDLLLIYNLPKASVTLLKKGDYNFSEIDGEISWKKKLYYKEIEDDNLDDTFDELLTKIKNDQRFVIVNNFKNIIAYDTKTSDRIDFEFNDFPAHYDFFLPWAGIEKAQYLDENPADVKAAVKMAKLFDEIKEDNPDDSPEFIHDLNIFLSRLLFCFFAEDTEIFDTNKFTNAISSHTNEDGSDLNLWFEKFFYILNTDKKDRGEVSANCNSFPFVNGGLFAKKIKIPMFSKTSRKAIVEGGKLDWSAINPDIFGSMFQAVIGVDQRGDLGQHYTSVPNIMKVIEPLFLNDLNEQFEKAGENHNKLRLLLKRIENIKIFDPACGSGNFLIIAYKELRLLEMKIFKKGNFIKQFSNISLSKFYGIEIDDFASEIAMLALWLVEHQMNVEFFKEFGHTSSTLPLKEAGVIVQGNATRLDWEGVCPKKKGDEIYILGNPPYLGFKMQSEIQKADLSLILDGSSNYKFLDYISCWFLKASNFIDTNIKVAFVSTNSICQGVQVEILWPPVIENNIEIFFAHTSFKWSNSAKSKAGVSVVIIGLQKKTETVKFLFGNNLFITAKNINPYLINAKNIIIKKRKNVLSKFPKISDGSGALDGGNLILSKVEKASLLSEFPDASSFIRPYLGSDEFINGLERWCLWIEDERLADALNIQEIKNRVDSVKKFRINGGTRAQTAVGRPHKFAWINRPITSQIIIPTVSSERRHYVPIGFFDNSTIISNAASIIHNPEPFIFGIVASTIHLLWVKTIAGRLRTDIRYTSSICYNTFPFPTISEKQKENITKSVFRIIDEREKHPEKTMAQLYDPDKMPDGLREAHRENDLIIEQCYRDKPFKSDEERLEFLFKLYEEMIKEEEEKDSLFKETKKTKKKKK